MNFLDHTGHIFSIKSHNIEPIGWEYENLPYVFWLNNEYGFNLSIDNYYIKPIRFIYDLGNTVEVPDDLNISISLNSQFYKLIGGGNIQSKIEELDSIYNSIVINENDNSVIKTTLNNDDLFSKSEGKYEYVVFENSVGYTIPINNYTYTKNIINESGNSVSKTYNYSGQTFTKEGKTYGIINNIITGFKDEEVELTVNNSKSNRKFVFEIPDGETDVIEVTSNFLMITFYVIGYSENEGTFTTNILININNEEYCPICVGGTYVDEFEELTINARNYGIQLPKDIVRAIYNSNFYNETFNTSLYNDKLKELLMNYMLIKGECGNFNSAIVALKWFGWGDKITIYKLLETDNNFISQYILDDFNINTDIIDSYKNFRNSTYITLRVKANKELEECNDIIFSENNFWGEGKPKFEDLFNKVVEEKYDEKDISFYKPYYDYMLNELGLKLVALKYYYRKYFLPIHLKIHSASISTQVFTTDIKYTAFAHEQITADIYNVSDPKLTVILPKENFRFFYAHTFNVDANMCHFNYYDNESFYNKETVELYAINDSCITIPITFKSKDDKQYYKCVAVLSKINNNTEIQIAEYKFNFINTETEYFEELVIYPKLINSNFDINYWKDNDFVLYLNVNDVWYTYKFIVKVPELQIEMGILKYQYNVNNSINAFRQLISIENDTPVYNSFMYVPQLVEVNNSNFINELEYTYFNSQLYDNVDLTSTTLYHGIQHNVGKFTLVNDTRNRIKKYTELYRQQISIPSQDKYKNHCITFDINMVVNFTDIFNNDGTCKYTSLIYKTIDGKVNTIKFAGKYDLYLMQDIDDTEDNTVYIELISINTKDKLSDPINLKSKTITEIYLGDYVLEYIGEDYKFLVNRMTYIPYNGVNHFKTDDIIVAGLINNDNLPFRLALSSKWSITPLSIDITDKNELTSQTECAIISIGNDNMQYNKGYYNITVRYSIDNNIQNQQIKKAKFRIE